MHSASIEARFGQTDVTRKPRVAVVAMQGDYEKHILALEHVGAEAYSARTAREIDDADGIVLPGGESTTIGKLLVRYGLDDAIKRAAEAKRPIYGTCAGLILLANDIESETAERGGQPTLGLLDISVARNAFGRQLESFETTLEIPEVGPEPVPAVFIRAPIVVRTGPQVQTLATYDGRKVFVRQGHILGSSFHPELTADSRIHRYFISMIVGD